jgi:hypothetical protein
MQPIVNHLHSIFFNVTVDGDIDIISRDTQTRLQIKRDYSLNPIDQVVQYLTTQWNTILGTISTGSIIICSNFLPLK